MLSNTLWKACVRSNLLINEYSREFDVCLLNLTCFENLRSMKIIKGTVKDFIREGGRTKYKFEVLLIIPS